MLSVDFIRENKDLVERGAHDKNLEVDIDAILTLDEKRREIIQKTQALREERNQLSKQGVTDEAKNRGRAIKDELKQHEQKLSEVEKDLNERLLHVPNPAAEDVPVGTDEGGNVEVRKEGTIQEFSFSVKPHEELTLELDLYDSKRAVAIGGTRAYILKNELVILEQALLRFGLDYMVEEGFTAMTVPWMVNKEALWGTGYFPWGIEDHYTTQDEQGLIGTAEVSLTAYHQNDILNEKDLPIKLVGISPCFRREVGSYGKDTKGFIRVHQFNKVEQVVLTVADENFEREWHEKMLGHAEHVLMQLELPYRVLLMCTGDMGAGQRKKYDIETWFPSQKRYRETHSASYFNDFQARRLNMKYRTKDGQTQHVYTLNNTVVATPRLLAAIIENYQQEDGSIKVPKVLQSYTGFDTIGRK